MRGVAVREVPETPDGYQGHGGVALYGEVHAGAGFSFRDGGSRVSFFHESGEDGVFG